MEFDVIIVGAGPIGLMLGNLLGQKKLNTIILEKKQERQMTSKAIGVSPPSLGILKKLELSHDFINEGVKVRNVVVHGTNRELGRVSFQNIDSEFNYILSIPQYKTENILEKNLENFNNVKIMKGQEVFLVEKDDNMVKVDFKDVNNSKTRMYKAKYVCACDGNKSTIRNLLKINFNGGRYKDTFLMGDYIDESGFNDEAHLYFTKNGPVESFPLSGGKRRWIVETPEYFSDPDSGYIEKEVLKRAGIDISSSKKISESPFGVQHYLTSCYFGDKIIFCGDSAHVMSPIGGQGMNTGFADADLCACILEKIIKNNKPEDILLGKYDLYRRKAAMSATNRAWLSMRIGTMKGNFFSCIRNFFIKPFIKLFKNKIPVIYSMLTIPYCSVDKVRSKEKLLCEPD